MSMEMQIVCQRALSAIIFTVLLTGGVLSPCVAAAATYYVATTGSDANPGSQSQPFRTIDKGVSVLRAGDTLYIRGGTYDNQSLGQHAAHQLPSGTSWSNAVTIAAYPGETVTLPNSGISITDNNSYIIFDGLHLAPNGALFLSCGGHHIRFQNGEIATTAYNLVSGCGYNLEVLNSKIYGAQVSQFSPSDPTTTANYGFYWGGHDSLFEGNEVYDNTGYGFHIYSHGQNNVSNNIVRNNRIYRNGFDDGTRGNGSYAIIISNGSSNKVYNNLIYNNSAGIQVDYRCKNCEVYNNTIYGNTAGGAAGITIGATDTTGTIVKNNIVYNNGAPGIDNQGDPGAVISNNLTSNPVFVNATANDFRLQSTSPAIDAGVTLSAVPTDFNRIPRPQGARYDIGAYEYQVSTVPAPVPAPKNLKATPVVP